MGNLKQTKGCSTELMPDGDGEKDNDPPQRMTWTGSMDFMLSLIGYGVGLGNIWRFPYLCAKNGGAVFLIPYALFIVILAFPLTFLELSLGQYSGKSAYGVWDICPAFKGLGLAMSGISLICSLYYNTILAWVLYYLVHAFMSPLPWTTCDNWWNTEDCYIQDLIPNNTTNETILNIVNHTLVNSSYVLPSNMTTNSTADMVTVSKSYTPTEEFWNYNVLRISSGIHEFGSVQWHLVVALAIGWFIIFLCLIKGIQSVGKVVYITATVPYILITIILIKAVTLPGSMRGIKFYIIPDLSKLADIQVWIQALLQMFYSMGMGWGGFITMASYNKFDNNILRDSIIYCIVGEGTSFYAGFVVFSVLGFMSYQTGLEVVDLVRTGPGLVFITYPEALSNLPIPQLWTVLFFLMLLTVALDSMFVSAEVVITTIVDLMKNITLKKRAFITGVSCFLMFLVTLIYTTQAGIYIFQLVDWYMSSMTIYVVTISECIVVGWIYGADRYFDDLEMMLGRRPPVIFKILWKFVTPLILTAVLIITLITYQQPTYGDYHYPFTASVFGWIIALTTTVPVPIYMFIEIYHQKGTILQRIKSSLQPSLQWGPSIQYKPPSQCLDTAM